MMEPMRFLTLISTFVATVAFSVPALACPTCKGSLHDNGVATGYAISILFMMGMPFLISAFWAVVIYRLRKQMQVESIAELTA